MAGQIILNERLDLLFSNLRFIGHDVGTGQLVAAAAGVRDADDGGVEDLVVREEQGFELRGRDLEAFVFDEFLERGEYVLAY